MDAHENSTLMLNIQSAFCSFLALAPKLLRLHAHKAKIYSHFNSFTPSKTTSVYIHYRYDQLINHYISLDDNLKVLQTCQQYG